MKNKKYRNIENGHIITAYRFALIECKEGWKEQKALNCISEDSPDFDHWVKPDREQLIEYGCMRLDESEDWEEI